MNRRLLITGTTSGVGLSLAEYLSQRFEVIALNRNASRLGERLSERDDIKTYAADLEDPRRTDEVVGDIVRQHGPIGYLINNAGLMTRSSLTDLSRDRLLQSLQVNAIAAWQIMRLVLPGMVSEGFGRVINLTSGAPLNCFPEFAAYSASKAALNAVTVTAAREYEDQNIRINLMSPGPVRSNMSRAAAMEPLVCHPTVDYLLDIPPDGPTGRFFWLGHEIPLFPNLEGVDWLAGTTTQHFRWVLPS